ncbi:(d)CMP kinase [Amorphus orientalis]|uniref:Cytidylate kinase n=1 Tax=Amorphus orientalis TaxID=649198 RepID=A0AAE3VKP8_9HYPH|nr:(d)CMP kinase [Amorphus orientalis]MDQ0313805.1 cytidylate kinase [Amorphus orientalis]
MIIAIDGPAASGKGTMARRLAAHFGLRYLDTGLTYRAVAQALMADGASLDDEQAAERMVRDVDFEAMDRTALSEHAVGEAASRIAVLPGVRTALVEQQRAFAEEPPGAVLDGRDIGTVVCPHALVKLFVTATPEARARRRTEEMAARGGSVTYDDVLADLRRRDERDSTRAVAPLAVAPDAVLLDTTDLDIDAAFRAAVDIVDAAVRSQDRG